MHIPLWSGIVTLSIQGQRAICDGLGDLNGPDYWAGLPPVILNGKTADRSNPGCKTIVKLDSGGILGYCDPEISKEYGSLIQMCPLIRDMKAVQSASITALRFAADDRHGLYRAMTHSL